MPKKVLILKESELVTLIQSTINDINEQTMQPDIFAGGGGGGLGGGHTVGGYVSGTIGGGKGSPEWVGEFIKTIGNFFHKAFIECDTTLDCAQNGLDAIALVTAFIPGWGWGVSILAGLTSAGISYHKEEYAKATAMVVFEMFPIMRIGKRVSKGVKALQNADIENVMIKMFSRNFNMGFYRTLKGKDKEVADYLLKNVDDIEIDVMKAVKNIKNNKAVKDLINLDDASLMLLAKETGTNSTNLKTAIKMMKEQARGLDDYADIFNRWRIVAKEIGFIGAMITTGIATYLGADWVFKTLYGGDSELLERVNEQAEKVAEDYGIAIGQGYAAEMAPCRLFAELLLLVEGNCNVEFTSYLRDSLWDIKGMSSIEIIKEYLGTYSEGAERNKEIKRIFEEYAGYGTACLSKKWKGGKTEDTVYLDYYAKALDCGADCCGTKG